MVILENLQRWKVYNLLAACIVLGSSVSTTAIAAELPAQDTYATHGLQSFEKHVKDMNDSGITSGQAAINTDSDTFAHAVNWDETGTLIDLDPNNLNTDSISYGINNLGDSVGNLFGVGSVKGPVLFTQGSIVRLLDQFGVEAPGASALDINDNGLIVGCANDVPVQWSNEVIAVPVSGTPAGSTGCAVTANNKGDIVGFVVVNGNKHAALWRAGKMTDLGVLPGHESSTASGINELGQVVGSSSDLDGSNANNTRPFLWDNGVMTDLGTLSGNSGQAFDINDQGMIVGNAPGPFLYRDGVMYDLSAVATLLKDAVAINEYGQIAGTAYVLTPEPNQHDMTVSMTAPEGPLAADTVYNYEISVTNRSTVDGNNVTLTNSLSSKLEVISATGSQGTCSTSVPVICELGTVTAQTSAHITLTVRPQVPFSPTGNLVYVSNYATVASGNNDINSANNSAYRSTTIIPPVQPEGADLSVRLSDSPDPLPPGSELTYTSTVINNGALTAVNTIFTQSIYVGFKIRSITSTQGNCSGRDIIQCDLGDLTASENVTITVRISPRTRNVDRFFSTANISSDSYDATTSNNSSSVMTTVQ